LHDMVYQNCTEITPCSSRWANIFGRFQ
jgi:hypothetical protein